MAKGPVFAHHVSPISIAKYTFLDKPQEPYEGKGDPSFKVRCIIPDTPENRAWVQNVADTAVAEAKKNGIKLKKVFNNPFNFPEDQDEDDFMPEEGKDRPKLDEDHRDAIFFDAKGKFKPALIDSVRETLPDSVKIMGGDKIRAKFEAIPYEGLGSGFSLRVKVVQLVEKNTSFSGGRANVDGFDDVEGGYVSQPDDGYEGPEDSNPQEDF